MGRLAGFSYREIVKRLKQLGFESHRQAAGSHEIWLNPATNRYTTIPNHPGDMPKALCAPSSSKPMSTRKVLAELTTTATKDNPRHAACRADWREPCFF